MPSQSGMNPADLSGLSGKELARARRAALSKQGKAAVTNKTASINRSSKQAASSINSNQVRSSESEDYSANQMTDQLCATIDSADFGTESNRVRNLCRERRQALSTVGKKAVKTNGKPSGRVRPQQSVVQNDTMIEHAGDNTQSSTSSFDHELSEICSIADDAPERFGSQAKTVRDICRARRQALSERGTRAVPPKPQSQGGPGRNGYQIDGYLDTALHGRDAAKRHREMLCQYGRGTAPSCRPTGRGKKTEQASTEAPKKVETGHTLSGGSVSGTQVDRKSSVTGNEPGTCRTVTGTEYVGSEQFQSFCNTNPAPNPAKVNVTSTARGRSVSGTEVSRTEKVTGNESGVCRNVTGTEYMSNEAHLSLCGTVARPSSAEKVMFGSTARTHQTVSGSDEFRPSSVTGNESGVKRTITGSQYADEGLARLTINGAPPKVAKTHTFAGSDVTGTEVGRSTRVTGDESGSCRSISGTEYLSNEQYQSFCGTQPQRSPFKVGQDRTSKGQSVTGNLVDRTELVTGNEPGSCARVTGSQYGQSKLCGGGTDKVRSMRTLRGTSISGQQLDHGPKMSGDERGGCMPVTGNEYYGREHFEPFCASTPEPETQHVEQSLTCDGQSISGTSVDASELVTGNEAGEQHLVSGDAYVGAQQTGCAPKRSGFIQTGPSEMQLHSSRTDRAYQPAQASEQRNVMPEDFSIRTPARSAQQRVTGNDVDPSGRITGPSMLATGLITGTPEFRHSLREPVTTPQPMAMAMANRKQVQPEAVQEPPVVEEQQAPAHELVCAPRSQPADRISGEGEERCQITGDDWSVNKHITGTAGQWASGRNPSQRGNARSIEKNAYANRHVPKPEQPSSKITGSSGNDSQGSLITYSGGARG